MERKGRSYWQPAEFKKHVKRTCVERLDKGTSRAWNGSLDHDGHGGSSDHNAKGIKSRNWIEYAKDASVDVERNEADKRT